MRDRAARFRPARPYHSAAAHIPPRTADTGLASFVLRDFDADAYRARAEGAGWPLAPRRSAGGARRLCDRRDGGFRVVAYFTVQHVAGS